jgi:epoxyqueuosine reductase
MLENERHEVAAYTLGFGGEDYHQALKRSLDSIFHELNNQILELERFIALDAQPILERDLAYRAGLGWFGKNSMLIHQKEGSYFIIGSLLLNQKLNLDQPTLDVDHCGQCNACVEACPTQVIDPVTRTIDAANCISTFTIEIFKEAEAPKGFEKSRGEIFGCDICQDVCPWNRKPLGRVESKVAYRPEFAFLEGLIYDRNRLTSTLESESNRGVRRKFAGTAFERPGKEGWLKNLKN